MLRKNVRDISVKNRYCIFCKLEINSKFKETRASNSSSIFKLLLIVERIYHIQILRDFPKSHFRKNQVINDTFSVVEN
jgi:hypothetical protein